MGKNVSVLYKNKSEDVSSSVAMCDMTIGKVYPAYLPEEGETDPYGMEVIYHDEVWILKDDEGEKVVIQLSDGLEIVAAD